MNKRIAEHEIWKAVQTSQQQSLTMDKEYIVIEDHPNNIKIKNDTGGVFWYQKHYFYKSNQLNTLKDAT